MVNLTLIREDRRKMIRGMSEDIKENFPNPTSEQVEEYLACGEENLDPVELCYFLDLVEK